MKMTQIDKGQSFLELHQKPGTFVMPNAWNAGSASLLAAEGFHAIATTSAGIAFALGIPDYQGELSREAALEETTRIVKSVDVPVSVDAENGYGHSPEAVAECIKLIGATGAVGAGIEDYAASYGTGKLYDSHLSIERIQAAREAADSLGFPFTLTARAECYLIKHEDAFGESVSRLNAYREAGADCLYAPGLTDKNTIARLAEEVNGPINVVMGLSGKSFSVDELQKLGVKRVSIGGSLARATLGLIRQAAQELIQQGTFSFSDKQIPDRELSRFFSKK